MVDAMKHQSEPTVSEFMQRFEQLESSVMEVKKDMKCVWDNFCTFLKDYASTKNGLIEEIGKISYRL